MKLGVFVVFLASVVSLAWAQSLEVFSLQHRPAEEVLPQLQPLLEPGEALTGSGDKLFLRASARNQAEMRRAIEALDRPLRRLMITVRQGGASEGQRAGIGGVVVLAPGEDGVRARAGERRYTTRESISQQVQTVEGRRAWINVGREIALPFNEVVSTPAGVVVSRGMIWHDVGTGFEAEPRLAGNNVTIDISPRHDTLGVVPGNVNVRRLSTTVSGRLGEWIALGGTRRENSGDSREVGNAMHYATRSRNEQGELWLKVEELP